MSEGDAFQAGDLVWLDYLGRQKPGKIVEVCGDRAIVLFPTIYDEFYWSLPSAS